MSDVEENIDYKNDNLYRGKLTAIQYHVTRESGTERPFTGKYNLENREGNLGYANSIFQHLSEKKFL